MRPSYCARTFSASVALLLRPGPVQSRGAGFFVHQRRRRARGQPGQGFADVAVLSAVYCDRVSPHTVAASQTHSRLVRHFGERGYARPERESLELMRSFAGLVIRNAGRSVALLTDHFARRGAADPGAEAAALAEAATKLMNIPQVEDVEAIARAIRTVEVLGGAAANTSAVTRLSRIINEPCQATTKRYLRITGKGYTVK
jgi:hypothetical protein